MLHLKKFSDFLLKVYFKKVTEISSITTKKYRRYQTPYILKKYQRYR